MFFSEMLTFYSANSIAAFFCFSCITSLPEFIEFLIGIDKNRQKVYNCIKIRFLRGIKMKSIKIVALILIFTLLFSFVGCKKDDGKDYVQGGGGSGDENPGKSDEGNDEGNGETDFSKITYVYKDKTLHRENCYHARAMDELYKKEYRGDLALLVEKGFSFCSLCCTDEKALYADENDNVPGGVDPEYATYVLNIERNKFHTLDCQFVETMNPQNMEYTNLDRDSIVNEGYQPCQTCNP